MSVNAYISALSKMSISLRRSSTKNCRGKLVLAFDKYPKRWLFTRGCKHFGSWKINKSSLNIRDCVRGLCFMKKLTKVTDYSQVVASTCVREYWCWISRTCRSVSFLYIRVRFQPLALTNTFSTFDNLGDLKAKSLQTFRLTVTFCWAPHPCPRATFFGRRWRSSRSIAASSCLRSPFWAPLLASDSSTIACIAFCWAS